MGDARHRVGVIETRGVEPVPDAERHGGPLGLSWMWFGANMRVSGITLGAALVTFSGLNVIQAAMVAVVGAGLSFDSWLGENSPGWLVTLVTAAALHAGARAAGGEQTRFPVPAPVGSEAGRG